MRRWFRLLRIARTLSHHDVLLPPEIAGRLPVWARTLCTILHPFPARTTARPGQRLAQALENLGPVFIKLGQLLSTRGDIFGPAFCADLAHLKDAMPAVPVSAITAEVTAALGPGAVPVLEPAVAAASVAQVHKITAADGRVLALKVLRPGIEQAVARDLEALDLLMHVIERLIPAARRMEPVAFAAVVEEATRRELDLRLEAAHADELRTHHAADAQVLIPAVNWDLTSKHTLALDWIDGTPLAQVPKPAPEAARLVMQNFLKQALEFGLFHADPHEGNLFLTADGRLAYVDFGIMGRLTPDERRWLADILWGFITRDYDRIARAHVEAGYIGPDQNSADFASALRAVGEPIVGKPAGDISMARVLEQLFDITALFGMHLRPELVLLQKTMVTAEGVARALDPDFDMWTASRPVIEPFIRRELGPRATLRRGLAQIQSGLRAWADAPKRLAALEAALLRPRRSLLLPLALAAAIGGLLGALVVKVFS